MSKRAKPLKKFVQLVTQANDCGLLPRLNFQDAFSEAIATAGETSKRVRDTRDIFDRPTARTVYILKNGKADYFVSKKDKRIIPYIQKAKLGFIDEGGNSYKWKSPLHERLYLEFINIKTKEVLDKFVQKRGFCIFPSRAEAIMLLEKYKNHRPEFLASNGVKVPEELITKMNIYKVDMVRANLDFIWEKKLELERMVKRYSKGELEYYRLHWINEQMENVSEILFNKTNKILDEIRMGIKTKIATDERTPKEIVGMETISKFSIIPAFRVYGHYAYCCLEFYLDIMRKNKMMVCKNCGQINYIKNNQHSDRETCLPGENLSCARDVAAKNKASWRKKIIA